MKGLSLYDRGAGLSLATIVICFIAGLSHAQSPLAFTQPAGPVRATNATLNGMAVPRGSQTTAWFEWGTDTSYGNTTAPQIVGNGTRVVRVSAPLENLAVGGVYHFRLVASNSVGVTRGFDSILTTAMRIQYWGSFTALGDPVVPSGLTNLSGIASGHRHSLAIRNDGTVVVWMAGTLIYNYFSAGQTNVPAGLSNVVAVAGGFSHCLALRDDGTVLAWGKYADGTPADVPANATNVIAISGGDYHSVALKADGTLLAWGKDYSFGGVIIVPPGLSNVVAISCGTEHTLALKADGTVTTWGIGAGATTAPSSATNLVAVTTMALWNLALRGDGTVVEWGASYNSDVPKPANLTNVIAIATGYAYAEVLKADGTLQGWGRGQDATNIPPSLSNIVALASGDYHRVGLSPVNLPPRALNRTRSGGVNKALVVTLIGVDPNGDALSFRVTSLPAKGSLWQYTPTGLGDPINIPGMSVTDPTRVYFVPLPNDNGSPYDSFGLVASDGEFDSSPAT